MGGSLFAISCIPTAKDHDRVTSLLRDIEQHFEFTVMIEDGSRPSVYCVGLAYSDHIDVHGKYTDQEVTEIIEVISEAQARRADRKPIEVRFFTQDNSRKETYKEVTIKQ